jgi:hypothetical protein
MTNAQPPPQPPDDSGGPGGVGGTGVGPGGVGGIGVGPGGVGGIGVGPGGVGGMGVGPGGVGGVVHTAEVVNANAKLSAVVAPVTMTGPVETRSGVVPAQLSVTVAVQPTWLAPPDWARFITRDLEPAVAPDTVFHAVSQWEVEYSEINPGTVQPGIWLGGELTAWHRLTTHVYGEVFPL